MIDILFFVLFHFFDVLFFSLFCLFLCIILFSSLTFLIYYFFFFFLFFPFFGLFFLVFFHFCRKVSYPGSWSAALFGHSESPSEKTKIKNKLIFFFQLPVSGIERERMQEAFSRKRIW
ncbi:hypothetical protein B0J18DRAFT_416124 [Chaetomium sp. MPI-SDFR-AT-0129]|nr:hypothetical protein B0J18DRAFT_416124 [Chaetomium sp. MPI-SDFR-AT-0129]